MEFFTKTLKSLEHISSLDIFTKKDLENGINPRDFMLDSKGFFTSFIDGSLSMLCAYEYKILEAQFLKGNLPKIHFLKCHEFTSLNTKYIKILLLKSNLLDFRVHLNLIDTRIFYSHPLEICPICLNSFNKTFKHNFNKEEILNKLINNDLVRFI